MRKAPVSRGPLFTRAALLLLALHATPTFAQRSPHRGVSAPATPTGVPAFRARVEKILGSPDASRGYWGMLVEDADTGQLIFSLNADKYFLPASNAKLFTAALALSTLGPD